MTGMQGARVNPAPAYTDTRVALQQQQQLLLQQQQQQQQQARKRRRTELKVPLEAGPAFSSQVCWLT